MVARYLDNRVVWPADVKTNNLLMMQLLTKKLPPYGHLDQRIQSRYKS